MSAEDGVEVMIATPHANEVYHYDRQYLASAVKYLQSLVGDKPQIGLGCDFHLSYDNIQDALADPWRFTIQGTNYLLVELSNYSVPPQITESLLRLGQIGVKPILTHPERNPILQKSLQRVLDWAEVGTIVQVTASSFAGAWGEVAQESAEWLLKHDAVHVIASDAHDTKRRKPGLREARDLAARICGAEVAQNLVDGNPRAIVNNQPIPYFPSPVRKN